MIKHERQKLERLKRRADWLEKRMLPRTGDVTSFDWAEWSSLHWAIQIIEDYFKVTTYDTQHVRCCTEHNPLSFEPSPIDEIKSLREKLRLGALERERIKAMHPDLFPKKPSPAKSGKG